MGDIKTQKVKDLIDRFVENKLILTTRLLSHRERFFHSLPCQSTSFLGLRIACSLVRGMVSNEKEWCHSSHIEVLSSPCKFHASISLQLQKWQKWLTISIVKHSRLLVRCYDNNLFLSRKNNNLFSHFRQYQVDLRILHQKTFILKSYVCENWKGGFVDTMWHYNKSVFVCISKS